jgi:hypothetical protein
VQRNPASATRTNDGRLPIDPPFLTVLRELTSQHRVLLIFDEVVTGFRFSPGGAQAEYGITGLLHRLKRSGLREHVPTFTPFNCCSVIAAWATTAKYLRIACRVCAASSPLDLPAPQSSPRRSPPQPAPMNGRRRCAAVGYEAVIGHDAQELG